MPYENVIMGLMFFVSFTMSSLLIYTGILASRSGDKVMAVIGFLCGIGMLILSLPFLEYFGIVQLGILH